MFDFARRTIKNFFNITIKLTSYTFAIYLAVLIGGWFSIGYAIFIITGLFPLLHLDFFIGDYHIFYLLTIGGIIVTVISVLQFGIFYKLKIRLLPEKYNILNDNFKTFTELVKNNYSFKELDLIIRNLEKFKSFIIKNITLYTFIVLFFLFASILYLSPNIYFLKGYFGAILLAFIPALLIYRFSAFLISDYLISYSKKSIYSKLYRLKTDIVYPLSRTNMFRKFIKLAFFLFINFIVFHLLLISPLDPYLKKTAIFCYYIFVFSFSAFLIIVVVRSLYKIIRLIESSTDRAAKESIDISELQLYPIFSDSLQENIIYNLNSSLQELINKRKYMEEQITLKTKDIVKIKNFFQTLIDFLPVGVLYCSLNGEIMIANKLIKEETDDNIVGRYISDLFKKEIVDSILDVRVKTLSKSIPPVMFGGGYYKIVKRIFYEDNKPVGFVLGLVDVTNETIMFEEIKVTNELLEEKINEAVKASKAKSLFLANMSHEIRTPLNSIIGFIDVLLRDSTLDSNVKEKLKLMEASSYSLLQIISDILDVSKIESGKIEINPEYIDFYRFIDDVANVFKGNPQKSKDVDIIIYIDSNIPPEIEMDSLRVKQVLINLMSNAVKFTKKGYILLSVKLLKKSNKFCRISFEVEDTGIGIQEDRISKILQPFEQAEIGTTKTYGGTGLGLTISNKLIQLMGGQLSIKSVIGKGSTFKFDLNFNYNNSKKIEGEIKRKFKSIKDLKLVFLDDNNLNLKVYEEFCKIAGVKGWQLFADYEVLINTVLAEDVDIFIIDIHMPQKDGISVLADLKNTVRFKDKIFIAATSSSYHTEKYYINKGFSDVFLKPITLNDFLNKIDSLFSLNKKNRAVKKVNKFNLRILVVEDIKMNQIVIKDILSEYVDNIDIVSNGELAVHKAMKNKYDLILMDIHMPVMDGYTAAKYIRDFDNKVKIVALTADVMKETEEKCVEAGMNGVLSKPVRIKDLLPLLKSLTRLPVDEDGDVPENESLTAGWIQEFMSNLHLSTNDIKEILVEFKTSFAEKLEELKKKLDIKFIKEFEDISHAIKGEVRTLYHKELTEIFTNINNEAKKGRIIDNIESLLARVDKIWETVKSDIDKFISRN